MTTLLDDLLRTTAHVDDLDPAAMDQAYRSVRVAVTGRTRLASTVVVVPRIPGTRLARRLGLGFAGAAVVAAVAIGVAHISGDPGQGPSTTAVQTDNTVTTGDNAASVGNPNSPGWYEDNGDIVWRIFADKTAPEDYSRTLPSRFTAAELDDINARLEVLASSLTNGEFASHGYDARSDTVRVVTNIGQDRLPSDLVTSGALSYESATSASIVPPEETDTPEPMESQGPGQELPSTGD
jgi:hypothetical protein